MATPDETDRLVNERLNCGNYNPRMRKGFTLVEMSIVLVIIGLIIGGVLVGRDLISAATIRAQISQIEKYQTAVNTFRSKYGYLPGDIPDPTATQYGFTPRGQYAGEGDGNGLIEGNNQNVAGANSGTYFGMGETGVLWADLSTANLIDAGLNTATENSYPAILYTTGASMQYFFPPGKIGRGNYVYAYSGGISINPAAGGSNDNNNYFGLSAVNTLTGGYELFSTAGLTVSEAYSIDSKVDDGLPQSGKVTALMINWANYPAGSTNKVVWAGGTALGGASTAYAGGGLPTTAATPASSTTCYDNGNITGVQRYSMGQNSGSGINCALSFKFQ